MLTFSDATLNAFVAAFFYPFARLLALMSIAPVWSHASFPLPAKLGFALAFTALLAPLLPPPPAVALFSAAGIGLLIEQILIGVTLGFTMQLVFAAVALAGDLAGLQMGLSFASFVDPQNAQEAPLVGAFLTLVATLVFLAMNGHLALLAALADSFRSFPVDPGRLHLVDAYALVSSAASLFATGLSLALPIIAALLLINLTLGVLTRTAPQLNLFAVGFPVTVIGGLLMLALSMPFLVPAIESALGRALASLLR